MPENALAPDRDLACEILDILAGCEEYPGVSVRRQRRDASRFVIRDGAVQSMLQHVGLDHRPEAHVVRSLHHGRINIAALDALNQRLVDIETHQRELIEFASFFDRGDGVVDARGPRAEHADKVRVRLDERAAGLRLAVRESKSIGDTRDRHFRKLGGKRLLEARLALVQIELARLGDNGD
jgi:hypothetical protein